MEGIICPLVEIRLAESEKPSSSTVFLRLSYDRVNIYLRTIDKMVDGTEF